MNLFGFTIIRTKEFERLNTLEHSYKKITYAQRSVIKDLQNELNARKAQIKEMIKRP